VDEESASMRFVDGSALLRHYFIRLGFLDAWRRVVDARREADVFSRLEANLNRLAEGSPLRLTIPVAYLEAEPLPPRQRQPPGGGGRPAGSPFSTRASATRLSASGLPGRIT
jgi:hypothetical protein